MATRRNEKARAEIPCSVMNMKGEAVPSIEHRLPPPEPAGRTYIACVAERWN